MYSKFTLLFFAMLSLAGSKLLSQEIIDNPTQIQEIPPPPTMWEFQKYGDYPVSMHTGVPNISIPFFSLRSGQLSLPISINYHASGIKVEQRATWVGLGWSLNAGGAITRTVRGGNDEWDDGYIDYPYDPGFSLSNEKFKAEAILHGAIDTQPDIFYYNFMGYSGRFVFNHSTERENATIALIPHNDLKVVPVFDQTNIIGFTITTPEGIVAEFGYPEYSNQTRSSLLGLFYTTAATTWHLKKLTGPNHIDEITFEYAEVGATGTVSDERYTDSQYISYFDACDANRYRIDNPTRTLSRTNYFDVKKISRINFRNGYALFQSSKDNRLDDPFNYEMRLDAVELYVDPDMDGNGSLVKAYEMEYGYLGQSGAPRMKLDKVYEVASDGTRNNPHEFQYNNSGIEQLPDRLSAAQDHWGYYNGALSNTTLIPQTTVTLSTTTSGTVTIGDANREPNINTVQAGMLNKIVYPTKGATVFEFESNDCMASERSGMPPIYHIAGGVRIKQITNFDSDGIQQFVKSYEYKRFDDSQVSSGVYNGVEFISVEDYQFSRTSYADVTCNFGAPIITETTLDGVSSSPTISKNFASVYYSEVKEYIGTPQDHEGYTWYHYDINKDVPFNGSGPSASLLINRDWDRWQLIRQETFKNGDSNPIAKVENVYEEIAYQTPVQGFMIGVYFDVPVLEYQGLPWAPIAIKYFKTLFTEPIMWKRLKQTVSTRDGVSTTQDFFYDTEIDHINLSKTVTTMSNGNKVETNIYYAEDVTGQSSLGSPNLTVAQKIALDRLKKNDQHRTSEAVQTVTTVKSATDIVLSEQATRTNYKTLPFGLTLSHELNTLKKDATQEARVIYENYDDYGNTLEISKADGPSTSYIWGYNKEYPVAKVENSPYAAIEALPGFGPGFDLGNGGLSADQENQLRSLPGALVTTYTYDPLVGITSMTDPRGYRITYVYDALNRLKEVRDEDNNLVTDYQYHYKGQTNQ